MDVGSPICVKPQSRCEYSILFVPCTAAVLVQSSTSRAGWEKLVLEIRENIPDEEEQQGIVCIHEFQLI